MKLYKSENGETVSCTCTLEQKKLLLSGGWSLVPPADKPAKKESKRPSLSRKKDED